VVIEHNLDVLLACDWLIDLGPEGGAAGGQVLFSGPPGDLARLSDNATGRFLRAALSAEQAWV
ncbi:MAG TPA: ABC transporter ATP-binding protein, partial [bacterium]|nr:ABC transporter ATP-binding protein [bacterium]